MMTISFVIQFWLDNLSSIPFVKNNFYNCVLYELAFRQF